MADLRLGGKSPGSLARSYHNFVLCRNATFKDSLKTAKSITIFSVLSSLILQYLLWVLVLTRILARIELSLVLERNSWAVFRFVGILIFFLFIVLTCCCFAFFLAVRAKSAARSTWVGFSFQFATRAHKETSIPDMGCHKSFINTEIIERKFVTFGSSIDRQKFLSPM